MFEPFGSRPGGLLERICAVQGALCLSLLAASMATLAAAPKYRVDYVVGFDPGQGEALLSVTITPVDGRLQRMRFDFDPDRHRGFAADGRLSQTASRVTWRPPKQGPGTLRFRYQVDHERGDGSFDAHITEDWALLRADRLLPPARVIAPGGGESIATLRFDLPKPWTNADIGYRLDNTQRAFVVRNPGRRFQQPNGWVIAGAVGTRRELINDMEVSVGAPKGDALRRNDILAVVNATALEIESTFGRLPPKLLIVGAGDPMWRGGLSSPNSLFMHSDRPMISENGTSSLVHELVHVVSRIRGVRGADWIAEGLAEFYSIDILRRSGLLTPMRADKALRWMARHGEKVKSLVHRNSAGPRTARAVTLFAALNSEIRDASDNAHSLDDVIRPFVGAGRIDVQQLRAAAAKVLGRPANALETALLDE